MPFVKTKLYTTTTVRLLLDTKSNIQIAMPFNEHIQQVIQIHIHVATSCILVRLDSNLISEKPST